MQGRTINQGRPERIRRGAGMSERSYTLFFWRRLRARAERYVPRSRRATGVILGRERRAGVDEVFEPLSVSNILAIEEFIVCYS